MPDLLSRSTDTRSTSPDALDASEDASGREARADQRSTRRAASALKDGLSKNGGARPRATAFELICFLVTPVLHAIPWLADGLPACGLLGIAGGLFLITRRSWVASFWATWLWSIAAIGGAFYWAPDAMAFTLSSGYGLGLVVAMPLIIWDGLRLALGYWLAARLTRDVRTIWLPAALTTMTLEFAVPGVFPWRLGFVLLPWPWFTQAVDVFGAAWPTFIAFAMAGLLVALIAWLVGRLRKPSAARTRHTSRVTERTGGYGVAWATIPIVSLNLAYGLWSMNYWQKRIDAAPKTRVALVQVDPSYTESLEQARDLTRTVSGDVDLVCWPESSGGNYELALEELNDDERVFMSSREPERGLRPWPSPSCELLLGGKNYVGDRDQPDELYVTAMLIDPSEKIAGRYNKRFLMPFGEYVPFENTVPGLAALFDMAEHMTPGAQAKVITSATGAKLGAMLCYEDMVPQASRDMTLQGANVLVSLINGSAFQSPHTLAQHRLLAQLRSLECRRYFLRCAATGETCVIDPLGVIISRLPLQKNGVLKTDVALLEGRTFYSQFPWAGIGLCAAGLCLQVASSVRRQRHSGQRSVAGR